MEYKKFILKNGVEIPVIGFGTGVIKKYIPGWQKFSYDNLPINVIYKESKYHFEIITKEEYNKELILFFDWAKNQLIK